MWKYVINTNNLYQVNENGDIKSLPRTVKSRGGFRTTKEKILKHNISKNGYHLVGLHVDGIKLKLYVHRLVAIAFIENDDPTHKTQVDHIDGNLNNNSASNLRWCTHEQNNNFELHRKRISKSKKGKCPKSVLNLKKAIHQIDMVTGEIVGEFQSAKKASIITSISHSGISAAATHKKCTKNGYTWHSQSAGGYYWRYI